MNLKLILTVLFPTNMRAYRIQQPESKTDYYTTDFMDIWTELESSVVTVQITPLDVTVAEFHELIKNNINGPEKID